jgi:hypothetical protein
VRRRFLRWRYKVTANGTTLRGGIAAGADVLAKESGEKWLVLATDLRPSNAGPPVPKLDLRGIHVDVMLACEDAIGTCQERKSTWGHELKTHHALSVEFFPLQQAGQVLTR